MQYEGFLTQFINLRHGEKAAGEPVEERQELHREHFHPRLWVLAELG